MATALKQQIDDTPAAVTEQAPKSCKRRIVLPIFIVLLAFGAYWAFQKWNYGRSHESTDNSAVDGHLVPVLSKVSGYVKAVNARDNDHVAQDSLLVQIDPAEYQVRVASAEADLAAARASAGGAGSNG